MPNVVANIRVAFATKTEDAKLAFKDLIPLDDGDDAYRFHPGFGQQNTGWSLELARRRSMDTTLQDTARTIHLHQELTTH